MYSPGKGRDESVFNLPAINFNGIRGCCTAWTLSPLVSFPVVSSTVCSRVPLSMSDFFLLPCGIAPPSLPTLAGLSYTHYAFHTRSAPPAPPSFLSLLQCLHMQSLSECAMSFLLGSAASFTVDWFLFRSRGNGPPFSIILPSSLPSSRRAGGRRGKWARRALHGGWARCAGPRAPLPGEDGAVLPVCPPRPPRPSPWSCGRAASPPRSPASRHGRPAVPRPEQPQLPGVGRNEPGRVGRGRFVPLGQICSQCDPPPPLPRPAAPSPCTQTPTRAQTRHGICPPDLLRSSGKRDHKCNRL